MTEVRPPLMELLERFRTQSARFFAAQRAVMEAIRRVEVALEHAKRPEEPAQEARQ